MGPSSPALPPGSAAGRGKLGFQARCTPNFHPIAFPCFLGRICSKKLGSRVLTAQYPRCPPVSVLKVAGAADHSPAASVPAPGRLQGQCQDTAALRPQERGPRPPQAPAGSLPSAPRTQAMGTCPSTVGSHNDDSSRGPHFLPTSEASFSCDRPGVWESARECSRVLHSHWNPPPSARGCRTMGGPRPVPALPVQRVTCLGLSGSECGGDGGFGEQMFWLTRMWRVARA